MSNERNRPTPNETGTENERGPSHTVELRSSDRPSSVVVRTVAALGEHDPLGMEPLFDFVDPDALDDVFSPTHDGTPRTAGSITFRYCGFWVTFDGQHVHFRTIEGQDQ